MDLIDELMTVAGIRTRQVAISRLWARDRDRTPWGNLGDALFDDGLRGEEGGKKIDELTDAVAHLSPEGREQLYLDLTAHMDRGAEYARLDTLSDQIDQRLSQYGG
jgi:hypothetical protein